MTKTAMIAVTVIHTATRVGVRDGALKLGITPGGGGEAGVFGFNVSICKLERPSLIDYVVDIRTRQQEKSMARMYC